MEIPGPTEHVEMAFSGVFVDVCASHYIAQVFLTNYRCVCGGGVMVQANTRYSVTLHFPVTLYFYTIHSIDAHRLIILAAKSRTNQCGTNMWIALNNIQSIEVGDETIVSVQSCS